MNRLWVRLSLAISGIMLLFAILPLVAVLLFAADVRDNRLQNPGRPPRPRLERRIFTLWRNLPENVAGAIFLAGGIGIVGGIAASWILAAPITKLAAAAQAIGKGDLSTRVILKTHTRELDELAHSFNKMATDLQRAAELRNSLMADVSHELRTPLTVLEGNLRAALDHVYELDDEQIANLYAQTHHLIQLVNELRELTLAEAAQLPLNRQPISLVHLLQEIVAVFEPLAAEKGIKLTAQIAPALPTVLADQSRIRQVLHNLLANALRHTPSGGTIVVAGEVKSGRVNLAVRDSGDGIESAQIEHVFDRFYRTDPSRSRESGGSGLGLAIVKAIVEAHGGSVEASSPGVGKGSTFTLYFA
ncbi:MAG: ATP-binding protein [Chloroflexota bacterium]|nr:ATP-binding protein [Chloroflexota bacterium]